MRYDAHPFTTSPKGSAIWTASRNSLITQGDPTQHLVLTFSVFIRIIILCYVVKNYARLPRNKLVIKIYVMENIYHYEITAIVEETFVETVTNARQGLNVLPFDLKRAINETIRGASEPFPSWFLLLPRRPSFLTLYIPDKWLWIHSCDPCDTFLFITISLNIDYFKSSNFKHSYRIYNLPLLSFLLLYLKKMETFHDVVFKKIISLKNQLGIKCSTIINTFSFH